MPETEIDALLPIAHTDVLDERVAVLAANTIYQSLPRESRAEFEARDQVFPGDYLPDSIIRRLCSRGYAMYMDGKLIVLGGYHLENGILGMLEAAVGFYLTQRFYRGLQTGYQSASELLESTGPIHTKRILSQIPYLASWLLGLIDEFDRGAQGIEQRIVGQTATHEGVVQLIEQKGVDLLVAQMPLELRLQPDQAPSPHHIREIAKWLRSQERYLLEDDNIMGIILLYVSQIYGEDEVLLSNVQDLALATPIHLVICDLFESQIPIREADFVFFSTTGTIPLIYKFIEVADPDLPPDEIESLMIKLVNQQIGLKGGGRVFIAHTIRLIKTYVKGITQTMPVVETKPDPRETAELAAQEPHPLIAQLKVKFPRLRTIEGKHLEDPRAIPALVRTMLQMDPTLTETHIKDLIIALASQIISGSEALMGFSSKVRDYQIFATTEA